MIVVDVLSVSWESRRGALGTLERRVGAARECRHGMEVSMDERWRIQVDTDTCIGSGMCVGTSPDFFRFDEDDKSRPVAEVVDRDEAVIDAAESCPVEAILVRDAAGGVVAPTE
jgi:ferredoxin